MGFFVLLLLALVAQLWRIFIVEDRYGALANCDGCLGYGVLAADVPFWLAWIVVTGAAFLVRQRWLGSLLRLVSISALLVYVLDILVLKEFNSRLYLSWARLVLEEPGPVFDHLVATARWWSWLVLALGLVLLGWSYRSSEEPLALKRAGLPILVLACLGVVVMAMARPVVYVHGWTVVNVFDPRGKGSRSRPYGEDTLARIAAMPDQGPWCERMPGWRRRGDLVVLILESWSPYQSEMLTGLSNWTPWLDQIGARNGYYQRFMGGGYNTEQGLMSLLAGTPVLATLVPPLQGKNFEPAWGWPETLPGQFARAGFETAFLTTGDLGFQRKGDWLDHIGFEYIEGHEHPFYEDMKRLHFKSAPDRALYDRALDFWTEREDDRRLAMVVESVSAHMPWIQPETRMRREESVIRYMDKTAASFVHGLRHNGFFRQGGILVVVSDHRTLKAMTREEVDALGQDAFARLPMMIIGNRLPESDQDGLFHHADLTPSLAQLMTGKGCGYPGWKSLFEAPEGSRCVYNTRGDAPGRVEVYCSQGQGTVFLEGDQSYFEQSAGLSEEKREEILLELARLRVMADQHNQQYFHNVPR